MTQSNASGPPSPPPCCSLLPSLALAGGKECAEQHTQASYDEMAKKYAKHGYLGIETEKNAAGAYAISKIAPGSPAEKAGFQKGDVLVALNGARFGDDNKEAVKKAKSALGPGKAATYTVHPWRQREAAHGDPGGSAARGARAVGRRARGRAYLGAGGDQLTG